MAPSRSVPTVFTMTATDAMALVNGLPERSMIGVTALEVLLLAAMWVVDESRSPTCSLVASASGLGQRGEHELPDVVGTGERECLLGQGGAACEVELPDRRLDPGYGGR